MICPNLWRTVMAASDLGTLVVCKRAFLHDPNMVEEDPPHRFCSVRLGHLGDVARGAVSVHDVAQLGGELHGVAVHFLQQPAPHAERHCLQM